MRIKPIDFMAIMGRSKLIFIFMRCCSYGVRGNSTETMEEGGGYAFFIKGYIVQVSALPFTCKIQIM